jgi:hypothetical protein
MEEKIAEIVRDVFQRDMLKALQDDETRDERLIKEIAQALSGICVEPVGLEWENTRNQDWVSDTAFGQYSFGPSNDGWMAVLRRILEGQMDDLVFGYHFPTLEAAQHACQADFASRISSCLKTRTVEEVEAAHLERMIAHFDEAAAAEWDNAGCNDQEGGSEKDTKRFVHAAGNFQFCADQLRSLQQEGKGDA